MRDRLQKGVHIANFSKNKVFSCLLDILDIIIKTLVISFIEQCVITNFPYHALPYWWLVEGITKPKSIDHYEKFVLNVKSNNLTTSFFILI